MDLIWDQHIKTRCCLVARWNNSVFYLINDLLFILHNFVIASCDLINNEIQMVCCVVCGSEGTRHKTKNWDRKKEINLENDKQFERLAKNNVNILEKLTLVIDSNQSEDFEVIEVNIVIYGVIWILYNVVNSLFIMNKRSVITENPWCLDHIITWCQKRSNIVEYSK